MALPSGFLDDLRARLSIAQVVGRKVTWDNRKSNPGKGDYWAPCPFHQEKTASFHVDDKKGYYYCFGCQAKGDMIGFVKETENMSFMESVELLAREAGMPMPERDPKAQEQADARQVLVDVMEEAVKFCRLQLKTARAADARDYLTRRGLTEETQSRFEIGFAPDTRRMMTEHLTGKGIAIEKVIEAGLAIAPDDGSAAFDRFRGRIIFPIRDARGRCIAFGGRAMSAEARAKYLNSPETPLFDKGRALYNHGPAREASGKSGQLIVAEGYMDVIALAMHGFGHAVAPLGTAITEDQLRLMWRVADEPIIALDGDKAGIRAAGRLIDLAMPMLQPGKTLRFVILPDGQDPDDLLKAAGASAMQKLLDEALPLIEMFWRRETEDLVLDSPERRAKFDTTLRAALARIADVSVRQHYEADIRARRSALFRPAQPQSGFNNRTQRGRNAPPARSTSNARATLLAQKSPDRLLESRIREATIIAVAVRNPDAARAEETRLETMRIENRDIAEIRTALLTSLRDGTDNPAIEAQLEKIVGKGTLEKLLNSGHIRSNPYVQRKVDPTTVSDVIANDVDRHHAILGHVAEVADAEADILASGDNEALTWRLQQAIHAKEAAARAGMNDDATTEDDEKEKSRHLQRLIDQKSWLKKTR